MRSKSISFFGIGLLLVLLMEGPRLVMSKPAVYPKGVTIYQPEKCGNGYTLLLYKEYYPALMDMNGRIVHIWDTVRAFDRAQLLRNGNLLTFCTGSSGTEPRDRIRNETNRLIELNWDGEKVWEYNTERTPHHDFQRLDNGNTLINFNESVPDEYKAKITDPKRRNHENIQAALIFEIDNEGKTVWEWHSYKHLDLNHYTPSEGLTDWTHLNSLQAIPENPWYQKWGYSFQTGKRTD